MGVDMTQKVRKSILKFSVSMCVYKNDNPLHFEKALKSILFQTLIPDEIVLVVDGPVPFETEHIINKYENISNLTVIRLLENVGHGEARRVALEHCSFELVALMDADDISVSDRFEKQVKCFENNEKLSVVGGNIEEFIGSIDNLVGIRNVPSNDLDIKEFMRKRCPFNQMTVMFKKTSVERAGGYKDWYHNEDYYLWIRMSQNDEVFMNLKDTLVFVRVGEEMYGRRGGVRYFKSEAKLQRYMLKREIIDVKTFVENILVRLIVQVLVPNKLRGFIFRKFARTSISNKNVSEVI